MITLKLLLLLFLQSVAKKSEIMEDMKKRAEEIGTYSEFQFEKNTSKGYLNKNQEIIDKKANDEYGMFFFAVEYSRMNMLLHQFHEISSKYLNRELLYRGIFDFNPKYFNDSPQNSKNINKFLIHSLRYNHISDNLKKVLEYKEIDIEKNIEFFDRFTDINIGRKMKIKFDWSGNFMINGDLKEEDGNNFSEELVNRQKKNDLISKCVEDTRFTYQRTPYLFSFCEGIVPNNTLNEIGETFERNFNNEDLYKKHHEKLKEFQNIDFQEKLNLLKIFYHFFDINLGYKNINSKNILHLDFIDLQKLIFNIEKLVKLDIKKMADFTRDTKTKEIPKVSETGYSMKTDSIIILENLNYVIELKKFTAEEWKFFRNYYFSNIEVCYIGLFLRIETIQKIRAFFEISDIYSRILNDEFIYYKLKKHDSNEYFFYESELCDSFDFRILRNINIPETKSQKINDDKEKNQKSNSTIFGRYNYLSGFLSTVWSKIAHKDNYLNKETQEKAEETFPSWFRNVYLNKKNIGNPKIFLEIEVCNSFSEKEYRYKISYERHDKTIYMFEIGCLKHFKIQHSFNFLIKIFKSEFLFYSKLKEIFRFEMRYIVNLPLKNSSFEINSYFQENNEYMYCSHEIMDSILSNLNKNIKRLAQKIPISEYFLPITEKDNVIEMKKIDGLYEYTQNFKFTPFSADYLNKYHSRDEHFIFQHYTNSGFIYRYVDNKNFIDAICYVRLFLGTNIHFDFILEKLREHSCEYIRMYIEEIKKSGEVIMNDLDLYLMIILDFFLNENLFRLESKRLITHISKWNATHYCKVQFIIQNLIDTIIDKNYNGVDIEYFKYDWTIIDDFKPNIVHFVCDKITIDLLKNISQRKRQMTLYVLDDDICIRKKIFAKLNEITIGKFWEIIGWE